MNKKLIKNKVRSQEKILTIAGIVLFVATTAFVVYTLNFLSAKLVTVLSADDSGDAGLRFDIDGFKNLNL